MRRSFFMPAVLLAAALLPAAFAGTAAAQTVYVPAQPVVTYYTPPTVSYYYTPPAVSYYYAPRVVTYYPPAPVVAAPVPYATTTTTYRGGVVFPRREVSVTRYYAPPVFVGP